MRISKVNISVIQKAFRKNFKPEDHLWIFGSRIDEKKSGGDLDLYIETHEQASKAIQNKMAFVNDLWRSLGEQKIDVVLNLLRHPSSLPIHKIAKKTGVQIV